MFATYGGSSANYLLLLWSWCLLLRALTQLRKSSTCLHSWWRADSTKLLLRTSGRRLCLVFPSNKRVAMKTTSDMEYANLGHLPEQYVSKPTHTLPRWNANKHTAHVVHRVHRVRSASCNRKNVFQYHRLSLYTPSRVPRTYAVTFSARTLSFFFF